MRTLLSKRRLFIALGLVTVLVAVVAFSGLSRVGQPGYRYRHCGHRPELKARLLAAFPYWQWVKGTDRWLTYQTMHGCSGDRARAVLQTVAFMQRAFRAQTGRNANSLSELTVSNRGLSANNPQLLSHGFQMDYESSGESWCACIPKQADLPGYYLVLSSGVYFSETRRPTTNDWPLVFLK
jgi:hypothetical protein